MATLQHIKIEKATAFKVLDKKFTEIRQRIHQGDIINAEIFLTRLLIDPNMRLYWKAILKKNVHAIWDVVNCVALSEQEETAFVSIETGYMCIGTQFLLRWFEHPIDLLSAVLHERNHILIDRLWPVRDFGLNAEVQNAAEDAYINAKISFIVGSDLPNRFFSQEKRDKNPIVLSSALFDAVKHILFKTHHNEHSERLWDMYQAMYSKNLISVSYHDWMHQYSLWWNALPKITILISAGFSKGDHDKEIEVESPLGQQIIKAIEKAKENQGDDPSKGYGPGNSLQKIPVSQHSKKDLELIRTLTDDEQTLFGVRGALNVHNALNSTLLLELAGKVASDFALEHDALIQTVIMPSHFQKKDIVLSACNALTYWNQTAVSLQSSVPLYIDVSGSMNSWYCFVVQLYDLLRTIVSPVYHFSTRLCEVTEPDAPFIYTDGGTEFNCIAENILQHCYPYVIIFSDGYADISEKNAIALKQSGVEIYYIRSPGGSPEYDPWVPLAKKIIQLEGIPYEEESAS